MRHSGREYIADAVDNQVRQIVEDGKLDIWRMNEALAVNVHVDLRRRVSGCVFEPGLYWADESAWQLTRYINGGQP